MDDDRPYTSMTKQLPTDKNEFLRLIAQAQRDGVLLSHLAREYGVHPSTITERIRRYGWVTELVVINPHNGQLLRDVMPADDERKAA